MPSPSATPTPITPPRVPLVNPTTGLIDRAWYMFFLSLLNAAQTIDNNPDIGPNTESLIASYDAALQALAQNVDTQPIPADLTTELQKQIDAAGITDQCSTLISQVAELQKQIDALNSLPPPAQGTVTAVTGTAPVVSSGGIAPNISMAAASTSTDGYLTSTDWNTFNSKAPATSGTSILYGNGSGGFSNVTIGSGVSFAGGILSATGSGGTVTSVTGTAPVVSSGGTTPAISMAAANGSTNGYLTSTDWTTFNSKQPAGSYLTAVSVASSNGFAGTSSGGTTPSLTLSTSITGLLYGNGTALAAATISAPLGYSAGTLSITQSGTAGNGYLSSTDWNTFNGKQAALVSGTNIKTVGGTSLLGSGDVGTIGAGYGGTGQSTYAIGDLLYASASTTLSKLAGVATGNALISGGVTTAPSWGKIGLTTHVSGTLPVANGGTGTATAFTVGSVIFAGPSGTYSQNNSSFFWDNTNGRLGIQTTTPNTWLTVRMSHTPPSATAYNSGIQIHDEPNGVIPHLNLGVAYDGGANYGWLQVNNSTYGAYNLVLQYSGGAVLIGTTSSYFGARTAIVASGSQYGLEVQANNVSYYSQIVTNTATSGDNRFIYFGTEANGATQRGSITYNRAGGLVAYNVTSDYRSKTIFGPVTNSGEVIDQLRIYKGRMKNATIDRPMLIAHEAQGVTPYAVTGEKDAIDEKGNPIFQQMDHASYVPLILAELQQLRRRIAELENRK